VSRPISRRIRGVRAPVLLAVLAVVVGTTLVACTPSKAGSAAIVADSSLAESTLTSLAQEVRDVATAAKIPVPEADALNQRVVAVWVDEQLTQALADELQLTATQTDVDNLLGQFAGDQLTQIQVSSGIAPSMLSDAARAAVLRQQIAQRLAPGAPADQQAATLAKAYRDVAATVGVSVNPRFGSWNAETAQVDASSDVLSRPAEPPAAPGGVPVLPQQG
jgi:hypothetical protein